MCDHRADVQPLFADRKRFGKDVRTHPVSVAMLDCDFLVFDDFMQER
jgi:hypothetical protein